MSKCDVYLFGWCMTLVLPLLLNVSISLCSYRMFQMTQFTLKMEDTNSLHVERIRHRHQVKYPGLKVINDITR